MLQDFSQLIIQKTGSMRLPTQDKVNSFLSLQEKCAQYWPTSEELQMSFTDTGFVVRLLSEEDQSYYTIRVLELQNTMVSMRGRLLDNNFFLKMRSGAISEMIFCEVKTAVCLV